ncbi:hypothetical protein O9929_12255 [Vibrio lentus]|nr:hypothetical protein [Vibrio lentus]
MYVGLDSTKFVPKGSIALCHIREATTLFTDKALLPNTLAKTFNTKTFSFRCVSQNKRLSI